MSFTFSNRFPVTVGAVSLVAFLSFSVLVQAETKTILSEAIYSMGDGETPAFAEAMVLQKAKQRALEEAGTYVESFTHVRNLDLTLDEIKTIAGGVMKTEVVEHTRTLEGNSTRFYIKIRALVTTDRIEDLARRKQLGPLAAENKKLQNEVATLTRDLDDLKRQILQSNTEMEREVVLDKLRGVEKQFRQIRSTETTLFRRLVSGDELSAQVDTAFREEQERREAEQRRRERQKEALERVLTTLKTNGHTIAIGPPETDVSLDLPNLVSLRFAVTAEATQEAKLALQDLHLASNSDLPDDAAAQIDEVLNKLALVVTVVLKDGQEYVSVPQYIHNYKNPHAYDLNQLAQKKPTSVTVTISIPRNVVKLVASAEGAIRVADIPATDTRLGTKPRLSLTDQLNWELDEELNKIKKLESPKESKEAHAESQPAVMPQHEAMAPIITTVATTLKVPGVASVFNAYLAQVRRKISTMWSAPPVDVRAQFYSVVVKFRLHRDGSVTRVVIEQSSGNEYFDLAGKRAVVTANPLPAFPADLTKSYVDGFFTFTIGAPTDSPVGLDRERR